MPAELQVLNGHLQWKRIKLTGPRCLIGRRDNCHLVLKDAWVSREHTLIIETAPGEYKVQDLDSENGSYVNGKRITESPLQHQDLLRVGRTEMRFVCIAEPAVADQSDPPSHLSGGATPGERTISARAPVEALGTPLVESPAAADVTVFDAKADPASEPSAGRTDLRDRVRRLEKLLLQQEEENARLASENAVFKRAMAQGGFIDRTTGRFDVQRLVTPTPAPAAATTMTGLLANPLARIAWPVPGGGTVAPEAPEAEPDVARGVHRIGVVGAGGAGANVADALRRAGYRRCMAISCDEGLLQSLGMDASRRHLLRPQEPTVEACAREVAAAQLGLQANFREGLGTDRDLILIAFGLGGLVGSGSVPGLVQLLRDFDEVVREGDGDRAMTAGLLTLPTREELEDTAIRERAEAGADQLRKLLTAGQLTPCIVAANDRLDSWIPGGDDERRELGNDTLAGALDLLNRLPLTGAIAGDLDPDRLRALLSEAGLSTFGLAQSGSTTESDLAEAVRHALGEGLLFDRMAPSRARVAAVMAMIGNEAKDGVTELVTRLESAVSQAREILPQADVATGIYQDDGSGVRIVAYVGGLPFPESLIEEPQRAERR